MALKRTGPQVFKLRNEVLSFLTERNSPFAHYYANEQFTAKLAQYLTSREK